MQTRYKGIIAVLISGFIFGCMPLLAKIAFENGSNAINLVFWRFFITIPAFYLIIRIKGNIPLKIDKETFIKLLTISILGYAGTSITLFLSYNYISTGIATTIHFMYPVFVVLGSVLIFKERMNLTRFISVALCTAGIFMLYSGDSILNVKGLLLAFISSLTFSFYMLYLDKSGLKSMNTFKLTFYLCLLASIALFIFSIFTKTFTININLKGWLFTISLSLIISLGAVTLLATGVKTIGPQNSSILSTLEPITSIIIGFLVFNEKLSFKIIFGCLLVLISVIIITVFDKEPSQVEEKEFKTLS